MKIKTLILSTALLLTINIFAQSCLPEGIVFSSQADIDNFQTNYPGCTEIEGNVEIAGNDIINLDGLNVLTSVLGNLWIHDNDLLSNLSGLDNIISVGGYLKIGWNLTMISLSGLNNISSIGDYLNIENNEGLVEISDLNNLNSIGGNLIIYTNATLTSIAGLSNLSSIGGNVSFPGNAALINLSGLEGITSIPGELLLQYNTSLTSLTGLDNVSSIGEGLWIGLNEQLENLAGLGNLTTIGDYITIWGNSLLTNFSGLENVTNLSGYIELFDNENLISLNGFNNIDAGSVSNLLIYDNPTLSTCEVKSICDYLISPNGTIEIHDNATGCNSQQEVEDACDDVGITFNNFKNVPFIFPNPTEKEFSISDKYISAVNELIIYNHLGQIVSNIFSISNPIDISNLKPGIYYVEIVGDGLKTNEKLVIR